MDGNIDLGRSQRNRLLDLYRKDPSPCVRHRAHIILLMADGHAWALVATVLFCSTATIARWKSRFEAGGVDALREEKRGRGPRFAAWATLLVVWIKTLTPRDFGYCRSRWTCSRAAGPVIQRLSPEAVAIRPSSEVASLSVTPKN